MSSTQPTDSSPFSSRDISSAQLWAHLLRKDSSSSTLASSSEPVNAIIPPLAPLDKNGTSMRILLHDTQEHFEKFSIKVDNLIRHVDETKKEISTVNTLFQREHQVLTEELLDLVNRSQTEIQKSAGAPAQADVLEALTKSLDFRLEALDKRVDAIQMFNQTHSQTLQLQSQTLHALQEQQRTITSTIIPLIPLVQAIPLHILTSRNIIQDELRKLHGAVTNSAKENAHKATNPTLVHMGSNKRRMIVEDSDSSPVLAPPLKRLRTRSKPENELDHDSPTAMSPSRTWTSPSTKQQKDTCLGDSSPARTNASPLLTKWTCPPVDKLFTPDRPSSSEQGAHCSTGSSYTSRRAPQTTKVPTPVSDTLFPKRQNLSTTRATSDWQKRPAFIPTPQGRGERTIPGSNKRLPPPPPRYCTPSTVFTRNTKTPQTGSSASRTPLGSLFPANSTITMHGPSKDRIPPLFLPPSSRPHQTKAEPISEMQPLMDRRMAGVDPVAPSRGPTPLTDRILGRDRRSPQREGRRFIPLMDSDDEDEDDEG